MSEANDLDLDLLAFLVVTEGEYALERIEPVSDKTRNKWHTAKNQQCPFCFQT